MSIAPSPNISIVTRPEFEAGMRLYNDGEFYEAHEQWEILWLAEEDDEPRIFLQGLIQLTSAFHKLFGQRRPDGAARLLERALTKLDRYPPSYLGVALDELRDGARACLTAMTELAQQELAPEHFDRAQVPRLAFFSARSDEQY